jgi:PAS domain S-box-containing protein
MSAHARSFVSVYDASAGGIRPVQTGGVAPDRLVAAERAISTLVSQVADEAIVLLDPAGRVVTWNPGAERLTGVPAAEITGQPCAVLHADQPAGTGPSRELALAAERGSYTDEGWRVRRDGTRFWAHVTVNALRDPQGSIRAFGVIARDLTRWHRAEAFTRSILDHTAEAIISIDAAGLVRSFNRAAVQMFGYDEAEVLGQSVERLMPAPDTSRRDDAVSAFLRVTGDDQDAGAHRAIGVRKDGRRFRMELAITRFVVDGTVHFTWIVRDVEERAHLEEQLQQSRKLEAMGQLAGGVAHDFNNLLTIINGWCEALSADTAEARKGAAEQISGAASKAANLTGQLLSFSRKAVISPRVIDLNAIIDDISRMLRRLIGEDITFDAVLSGTPIFVKVDPGQMGQVLVNLAVNARDAMPRGGRLKMTTARVVLDRAAAADAGVGPGAYARVTITDTGTGIAPDVLPRIFEPFFTTKDDRGTGLGLATVYGIVRQADGAISAASPAGQGATFTILLPETNEACQTAAPVACVDQDRGSETVLIVEDEPQVRAIAVSMLKSRGYTVLEAADAAQALAVAGETPKIEMLVSDVVMPDLSGPEVASRIQMAHPEIRVLFMSGYTDEAVSRHGVNGGGVAFLQKPFTGRQLARKVREVLQLPPQAVPGGPTPTVTP